MGWLRRVVTGLGLALLGGIGGFLGSLLRRRSPVGRPTASRPPTDG